MKLTVLLLGAMLWLPSAVNAACTVDQRISLAKAGYKKQDIDRLCDASDRNEQGRADAPGASLSDREKIDFLSKGSMVGGNSKDYEKKRCYFREGGVLFRKKGFIPYEKLNSYAISKIDESDRTILLSISLNSGFNTENCQVMRVDTWKYRNNAQAFSSDLEKYKEEYSALLAALSAMSVKQENR